MTTLTVCRYQWVGIRWRCLDWWGAVCYFAAVLVYNIDSISGVVHDCTYINATVLVRLSTPACHNLPHPPPGPALPPFMSNGTVYCLIAL